MPLNIEEFQVVFSPVKFSSSYIMLIAVKLHSFEQMFQRLDTSFADRDAFCAVCGEGRSKECLSKQVTACSWSAAPKSWLAQCVGSA